MLIVFGLMSEVYLLEQDKKWYHFLLLIYIFLSLFPVNSKSSILCGFILIIEYIFYCGFRFYKENKIISIICFGVFALCVIFAIIIFSIPTTNDTVFSNFISACKGLFDETEASGLTLRSRFALWGKVISQLNLSPMFWIFGYGNSNFNYSFYYAIDESSGIRISPTFHAHNGFVQCLATGGIFRLALYAALLAYLAYRFIKKYREKHDIHIFMSILFFFVFLGRTIVEPEYMLCDSIKGLVYIFFIIEPILSNEKETDNDFEWNFIPKLFCEYKTILLGALGAACLLFAGVYKGIYGYAIALPIGITTYGFFIYLSIKEKGNRNILYITSALLLIFLLSTSFSLSSDVSLVAPIFAAVFGLYLPFVSYLICQCFLNKEIINY